MRIAVFTKNLVNPAYAAARLGAERAARPFGATVLQFAPEQPDDPDEQSALLAQALAAGVDAVVIATVHPTRVRPALERVAAAGVPMFGFVNPVGHPAAVSFVGADDARLGEDIAEYLFRALAGRGAVLALTGPADSVTSSDRVRGFEAAARRHAAIGFATWQDGRYQREAAKRVVTEALAQGIAFDAVLAANDVMALGALEALGAAGRRLPTVGVNAIPEAVRAIGRGEMLASADFNAMGMACVATECALRHLRGEAVPAHVELPVRIVDRDNWREWDAPYEARRLASLAELQG
jgi:ribose transport system substrate-binding protein